MFEDSSLLVLTILTIVCLPLWFIIFFIQRIRLNQAEEAIQWQKLTINSSRLLFIATDTNGYIQSLNASAERLLGYSQKELYNKFTPAIWHLPEEVIRHTQYLNDKYNIAITPGFETFIWEAKNNITATHEWTFKSKDGTLHPVSLTVHPLKNQKEQTIGYVGIIEDLQELKTQRIKLASQEAQIIATGKLAALSEMAAGIAHEINNPLTVINGNTANIRRIIGNRTDIDINHQLNKIDSTVERISKIIRGMRTLAKGATDTSPTPTAPENFIEDALSVCRERFKAHGIELELAPYPSIKVLGFHSQLSQVMLNILSNSYDALENIKKQKGEHAILWIKIEFEVSNTHLVIVVTDSGDGISAENQKRLFEPFFTTKETGKGLGLGLSLSQQIVAQHNGKLSYNPLANNTQFRIALPIAKENT